MASAKKEISQAGEEYVKAQLHRENGQGSVLKWSCKGGGEKRMVRDSMCKGPGQESSPSFRSSRSPVW